MCPACRISNTFSPPLLHWSSRGGSWSCPSPVRLWAKWQMSLCWMYAAVSPWLGWISLGGEEMGQSSTHILRQFHEGFLTNAKAFFSVVLGTADDQRCISPGAGVGFAQAAPHGRVHPDPWGAAVSLCLSRGLLKVVGQPRFVPRHPCCPKDRWPLLPQPSGMPSTSGGEKPKGSEKADGMSSPAADKRQQGGFFSRGHVWSTPIVFTSVGAGQPGTRSDASGRTCCLSGVSQGQDSAGGPGLPLQPPWLGSLLPQPPNRPLRAPKGCSPSVKTLFGSLLHSVLPLSEGKGGSGGVSAGRGGDVRRVSAVGGEGGESGAGGTEGWHGSCLLLCSSHVTLNAFWSGRWYPGEGAGAAGRWVRGWERAWRAGQGRDAAELLGSGWRCRRAGAPMGAVAQRADILHELFSVYFFLMYFFKSSTPSYEEGTSESSVIGQGASNTKINLLEQQSKTSMII